MTLERLSRMLMALSGFSFLPTIFVIAPILAVRSLRRLNEQRFAKLYDGLHIQPEQGPGLVRFRIHTYDGFLVWFRQATHEGFASSNDALRFVARALRYNLSHGLLAAGGLLIPLISLPEFFSQRRSVKLQAQQIPDEIAPVSGDPVPHAHSDTDRANLKTKDAPMSWIAAILWVIATIQLIVFLAANATSLAAGQGFNAGAILGAIGTVGLWAFAFDLTWR